MIDLSEILITWKKNNVVSYIAYVGFVSQLYLGSRELLGGIYRCRWDPRLRAFCARRIRPII